MVTNYSASPQPPNNSTTNTAGIVCQTQSSIQTTSNAVPRNSMNASYSNGNQSLGGQTSSNPNNSFVTNAQSKFIPNSTANSNLSASKVGTYSSQPSNPVNIFTKNNTNSFNQISNQPSAFTKFQNSNTNTNQHTTNIPSNSTITNQNQSTNFTQAQNTFPQTNNQNPLASFANQNQNHQLN
jgi:hypothetical protein